MTERAAQYDMVVIGAGPAGEKGAAQAAYFGKRVAIVERGKRPGGAAANNAWVPSKTLREAALYLTGFRRRDVYEGLSLDLDPKFAVGRLRDRSNRVIDIVTNEVGANIAAHGIELVRGHARLRPDRTVIVQADDGTTQTLAADVVLIATGSRPFHPDGIDFDDPDILDSETVLDVDEPITELLVVGGGAVGTEYASIFCALGTRVTLLDNASRLVPMMDHDVSDGLAAALRAAGVNVVLEAGRVAVTRDVEGLRVTRPDGGEFRPDKVLFAAGRTGNTEGLDCPTAGVELDERGRVIVDACYRTTAAGVYAAGDVIGPPALASVSMEQARVAACHAFGIDFKHVVDSAVPLGVYSIPEAAAVGLTEQQAATDGIDYEIGVSPFARNSAAEISGLTDGFVKLVFRCDDRRLIGVHVLGDSATELVHQGQAVVRLGGTIDHFIECVYNVPSRSEAYKYAAYNGLQRLAHHPAPTIGTEGKNI
ncbi:MAG TPA: Si-specific NAD(P)(+) transhydrogenase [Acidimicrobiia bacterium]|nr:Si-specific NAD(P)(+) transhydrogenase [Acidimicrobiia bacterium]